MRWHASVISHCRGQTARAHREWDVQGPLAERDVQQHVLVRTNALATGSSSWCFCGMEDSGEQLWCQQCPDQCATTVGSGQGLELLGDLVGVHFVVGYGYVRGLPSEPGANMHWHVLFGNLCRQGQFLQLP